MMLGWHVVSLMDRLSGVNDFRCNGFLVDDRLYGLMDWNAMSIKKSDKNRVRSPFLTVMVDMLSFHDRCGGRGVLRLVGDGSILELRSFTSKPGLRVFFVAVHESFLFHGRHLMLVLLW